MSGETSVTVPTNEASIFAALNTLVLSNSTQLAIVRPNNPPPGIAGFVFDIVDEDGSDLESQSTDYFTSANTPIQDHVSLMPEKVTVGGTVAEIVRTFVQDKPTEITNNPLPEIPGMEPQLTPGAEQTQQDALQTAQEEQAGIDSNNSLWTYYNARLPQQPNQTRQSLIYGYFYQLWKGRQLMSVETPWGIFTDMIIESMNATQGDKSKWTSQFKISFKKINISQSATIQPGQVAGRAFYQRAEITQNGNIGAVDSTYADFAKSQGFIRNNGP